LTTLYIQKHFLAALRVVLPEPLTHLSAFVSLNKDYLKPYDTIHAIAKAGDSFHGLVEISFASPTNSFPAGDRISVTGTEGWLSINEIEKPEGTFIRTVIKYVIKVGEDKPDEEKEEVIEEPKRGIVAEFASFFDAIQGKDELGLGDPFSALRDVAFVEAALNSNGELVDMTKLLQVQQQRKRWFFGW
jgi:predicted dehydrogenase